MSESSADPNNSFLCSRIYQYQSEKCGIRVTRLVKIKRKRNNHNIPLTTVKNLKKTDRKEFKAAKREGLSMDSQKSLVLNLFALVR